MSTGFRNNVKEIILCKWSDIFCVYWQFENPVKELTLKLTKKEVKFLKLDFLFKPPLATSRSQKDH